MATLSISFTNIALFAHRKNGLTVLLPRAKHELKVNDSVTDKSPYRLLRNGEPLAEPTQPVENAERLVSLNSLLDDAAISLPADADLDALAFRIELGGGELSELSPKLEDGFGHLADRAWGFGMGKSSMLTNRIKYTLQLEDGSTYALVDRNGQAVAAAHSVITIENTEQDEGLAAVDDFKATGDLKEFGHLYPLVKADGQQVQGPIPNTNPNPPLAAFNVHGATATTIAAANAAATAAATAFEECEAPFCPVAQVTET